MKTWKLWQRWFEDIHCVFDARPPPEPPHTYPPYSGHGAIKNLHRRAVKQIAELREGLVERKTRDEITLREGWGGQGTLAPRSVSFPPECIRQGLGVFQQIQENETAAAIWYYNLPGLGEFAPPTDCQCLWLNGNVFSCIFISSWLAGWENFYSMRKYKIANVGYTINGPHNK